MVRIMLAGAVLVVAGLLFPAYADEGDAVILHGCIRRGFWGEIIPPLTVENVSASSVRVRHVEVWGHTGELTNWMKRLGSHQSMTIAHTHSSLDGFYIYNLEGGLIGYIPVTCHE